MQPSACLTGQLQVGSGHRPFLSPSAGPSLSSSPDECQRNVLLGCENCGTSIYARHWGALLPAASQVAKASSSCTDSPAAPHQPPPACLVSQAQLGCGDHPTLAATAPTPSLRRSPVQRQRSSRSAALREVGPECVGRSKLCLRLLPLLLPHLGCALVLHQLAQRVALQEGEQYSMDQGPISWFDHLSVLLGLGCALH